MKRIVVVLLLLTAFASVLAACEPLKSPLEDRAWVLASYRGPDAVIHEAVAGVAVTATFDSQTGQVTGSGGVNSYGGAFHVDHLNVTVGSLVHTEMASANPALNQQESAFFQALQEAETFLVGHHVLTISGGGWELDFNEKTAAP